MQFLEKNSSRSKSAKLLLANYRSRFISDQDAPIRTREPFVRGLIQIYHTYYRKALIGTLTPNKAEGWLCSELKAHYSLHVRATGRQLSLEQLESKICGVLKRRGYFSLFGRILPFRSLLIWQTETTHTYVVQLPEGRQKVDVVFMDGFIEQSWMHFATFGRHYNAGWVEGNKAKSIHCVRRAYRLNSDKFLSGYLAHEAQHFKDLKEYPKLNQADLEYRAKLAELVTTSRPNGRAKKFAAQSDNNRSSPHAFASFCIMRNLARELGLNQASNMLKEWPSIPAKRLKELAKILMSRHSDQLRSAGVGTTGVL